MRAGRHTHCWPARVLFPNVQLKEHGSEIFIRPRHFTINMNWRKVGIVALIVLGVLFLIWSFWFIVVDFPY